MLCVSSLEAIQSASQLVSILRHIERYEIIVNKRRIVGDIRNTRGQTALLHIRKHNANVVYAKLVNLNIFFRLGSN